MLKHLYIKNFTLIDELDIDLHDGFSVITGETGAGKSIILGAIALLMGQRADQKSIKQGAERCIIEALFDLSRYEMSDFFQQNDLDFDGNECIVRRELTAAGKSRAFINDSPAPLALLKELGDQLIDVHSQHQNLLIQKQDFQMSVVDIIADNGSLCNNYSSSYSKLLDTIRQLHEMEESIEKSRQNRDFLQFQYDELNDAHLAEDEQEELEQESAKLTHAEDIKTALYEADNALSDDSHGVIVSLRNASAALSRISQVYKEANILASRLDTAYIELKDIAQEVEGGKDDVDFDPQELDRINSRLDRIYELQRKYHCDDVLSLIKQRDMLGQQLSAMENGDETLDELRKQCKEIELQCNRQAEILSKRRAEAARRIEKEITSRLVPLAMPNVRFVINIEETQLGKSGKDKVSFLFTANTSTPLQPVAQVASGGEIARVMLALKAMISGAVKLPTIIFDEIDTGVSGKTAEKMAEIMREMGQGGRQVISITHLPQIAALGSSHYRVEKHETPQGTISSMKELTYDERIREIAQMLSGSDISDAAIQNAKELLK